ncbi:MAG: methyltransferase [Verrucomicrobia bacterium]|nr:methyltransferase [Verrucomicrobiota bacterium]
MKTDKDFYRQLRVLSCGQLWKVEVARFNKATAKERMERVAVIRAVGVVFAASGTAEQRAEVRLWLVGLLRDPCEKIRRYAITALPKIGAGPGEEAELLSLLRTTVVEREQKSLGQALDKIGGPATLEVVDGGRGFLPQTEQKVKASVARSQRPSKIRMDRTLSRFTRLRIHLRCRRGLEKIVRDEVKERMGPQGRFRIAEVRRGLVAITPAVPFSVADLYTLRCFGTVNFVLGTVRSTNAAESIEALAATITSPLSRELLSTFTEGSIRYRLEFISKGHQRGAVRLVANRAYALCPDILNDARLAPWAIDIHPAGRGSSVELRPRLAPDPRFYYRRQDIAAASHPPLAACMARLAGKVEEEIVWDPFCGSGLELVERALLGGVQSVYGTDVSPEAIAIARDNFSVAKVKSIQSKFTCCDFRDFAAVEGLGPDSITLIITNPPMGRRIRIPDMRGLFADFFTVAATVLKPGGRLVFVNPLRIGPLDPSLQLQSRQVVDLGGFDGRLEVYLKSAR